MYVFGERMVIMAERKKKKSAVGKKRKATRAKRKRQPKLKVRVCYFPINAEMAEDIQSWVMSPFKKWLLQYNLALQPVDMRDVACSGASEKEREPIMVIFLDEKELDLPGDMADVCSSIMEQVEEQVYVIYFIDDGKDINRATYREEFGFPYERMESGDYVGEQGTIKVFRYAPEYDEERGEFYYENAMFAMLDELKNAVSIIYRDVVQREITRRTKYSEYLKS